MKRTLLAVAAVGFFLPLLLVSPASAAASHIQSLTVDSTAGTTGSTVRVTGTITCTAGDQAVIGAHVTQGTTTGSGMTVVTCTGYPQPYVIFVTSTSGTYVPGPATVRVQAQTATPGVDTGPNSTKTVSTDVTLVPPPGGGGA